MIIQICLYCRLYQHHPPQQMIPMKHQFIISSILFQKLYVINSTQISNIIKQIGQTNVTYAQNSFSNIERKNTKKKKIDPLAFLKEEINDYLNDDKTDSYRFLLANQSKEYKSLHQPGKEIFDTVPATSSPVERVFCQSGLGFVSAELRYHERHCKC